MSRLKLTTELLKDIRENVFGDCTVVYEAMDIEELEADLLKFLTEGRVVKDKKTGEYATYQASLTLTTLKQWLKLRILVEEYDAYPEHPFDKTDEQIAKEKRGRKALLSRLNGNVNKLMEKLRSTTL
jgi:hypothetical protein